MTDPTYYYVVYLDCQARLAVANFEWTDRDSANNYARTIDRCRMPIIVSGQVPGGAKGEHP